jgi:hypothetical protein
LERRLGITQCGRRVNGAARKFRIGSECRVNCSAISDDRRREQAFQPAIGACFGHETAFHARVLMKPAMHFYTILFARYCA